MKIPKSYKLFGHTVKIKKCKNLINEHEAIGRYIYLTNTIELQTKTKITDITESQIGHTFCHEVIHSWLTALNEHELNANEKFVDQMGGLLHQFLVSYKL